MFSRSRLWLKVCLLVVAAGLAGGAYAYSRFVYSPAGPRVFINSPPLEFSMQLNKAEFQHGQNITITFRLENTGNETISMWRGQPPIWPNNYKETQYFKVHGLDAYQEEREFHFGFRVTYPNGTEICDLSEGILAYAYDFSVDPGGWIEQTIVWDYHSTMWEEQDISTI